MSVDWTPALTERFEQLVAKGDSYDEIAKALSHEFRVRLTKNACVGKGRRLHVPLRQPPRKKLCLRRRNPNVTKPKNDRPSAQRKLLQNHERKRAKANRQNRKHRLHPSRSRDLPLLQLSTTSCRWPSGDVPNITFCGDYRAEGSSYCLKHTLIASPNYGRSR